MLRYTTGDGRHWHSQNPFLFYLREVKKLPLLALALSESVWFHFINMIADRQQIQLMTDL